MTADPMRTVPRVLVQTCGSLPAQESGWTTQRYVRFTSGSEGAGQFLGNAVLEQYFGTVQAPESLIYAQVGVAPDIANTGQSNGLDGQIVRILKEDDDAGTVTVAGVTYTPFWWGFIVSQSLSPDLGNGGMAVWSAVGLQGMLDQIVIRNGVVRSSDGVSLVNPGYLSEFNKLSGGDRSDSKFQMTHGMAYVHDLTSVTSGNYWSARDIVDLLLAGFTGMATVAGSQVYVIGGLKWVVSDPDGCLLYIPETINLDGETVFRSLVTLINERRGMTWWITVAANVVTINVQSTVSEAIASVGYTLPAASLTSSLDVTNDP